MSADTLEYEILVVIKIRQSSGQNSGFPRHSVIVSVLSPVRSIQLIRTLHLLKKVLAGVALGSHMEAVVTEVT